MAKWTELKLRYIFLHRFMCGMTVVCVILTIAGSCMAGISFNQMLMRTASVAVVLVIADWFIIRIWAVWEEVQHGAARK